MYTTNWCVFLNCNKQIKQQIEQETSFVAEICIVEGCEQHRVEHVLRYDPDASLAYLTVSP